MPNVVKGQGVPDGIRKAYLTQKRRRKYPRSYFLKVMPNGDRKFPYRDPKTGNVHCGLLRAAITRAAQYGYHGVEAKARSMYENLCKVKKEFLSEQVELVKEDEFDGIVLGIVSEPGTIDAHGDEITKEAIEEACWDYNMNSMHAKLSHRFDLGKDDVKVLESYIAPSDFEVKGRTIKEGTWLWRCKIENPKLKKAVKDGTIKGLSLGGYIVEAEYGQEA